MSYEKKIKEAINKINREIEILTHKVITLNFCEISQESKNPIVRQYLIEIERQRDFLYDLMYFVSKDKEVDEGCHDFNWAIENLKKGINVRRKEWFVDIYLYMVRSMENISKPETIFEVSSFGEKKYIPDDKDTNATDWELA